VADPLFFKAADGNYVYFEWVPTENKQESDKEGRPIYDKTLMMHVTSPGQTRTIPSFWIKRISLEGKEVINREYMARYSDQVKKFIEAEEGGKMEGTPLEQLPFLDVHVRAMLRSQNIHTAEALAELPENGVANVGMGGREWKMKAAAWMESANGGAPLVRMASENAKQAKQIESLQRQLAELAGKFEGIEEKRGPGRPRKVAEAEAA
jgi:hypothetical protein